MKKDSVEIWVGAFIVLGLVCVGYLAVKLGKMDILTGDRYYNLKARFETVGGLKGGAPVKMAGVTVGRVDTVNLDPENLVAIVELKIQKSVKLTDDVIASVRTSGLIGDKFVKLSPGGSDEILQPGDMIIETEAPFDIEELIGKYVFGGV